MGRQDPAPRDTAPRGAAQQDAVPGTALLLAAAPAGKGCLIDAASVLPSLAAVSPSVLTGTAAATVIELADPLDPQTVLTRIRAAAATTGPLSLYLTGQLHLDSKQHLIHLALARTTAATMRYTGLPWHWLVSELKLRRPGTTTVVVDLVADEEAWRRLGAEGLGLGYGTRVYGRVTPPPPRRTILAPEYLKACAAIWRSGARPPLVQLHEQAAARAGSGGVLFLAVAAPPLGTAPGAAPGSGPVPPPEDSVPLPEAPVSPQGRPEASVTPAAERETAVEGAEDPHPAILGAARAGRHSEAATIAAMWESEALRTHGPGSTQAIHWLEVRADLARLAREGARSCELWMAAAEARLARRQSPADEDVVAAVDRAHHQWETLRDRAAALALAPALVALRREVPGRRPGALAAMERRVENLDTAPAAP
ncbi:hypothetical protein [Streptomyces sp. NPDC088725]|uniref:hypothetical protein n=1 Tax=Streptomyces sp. NPDC088725 TaxID=3365873 RepID=UPI00380BD734